MHHVLIFWLAEVLFALSFSPWIHVSWILKCCLNQVSQPHDALNFPSASLKQWPVCHWPFTGAPQKYCLIQIIKWTFSWISVFRPLDESANTAKDRYSFFCFFLYQKLFASISFKVLPNHVVKYLKLTCFHIKKFNSLHLWIVSTFYFVWHLFP